MAKNSMESLVPVAFGLTAICAVMGFSAITPADALAYQERFFAYVDTARDVRPMQVELPPTPALVADAPTPLAKALALSTVRPHLETYVPDKVQGWAARPTHDADYQALTGVAPIIWSDVDPAIAKLEDEMAAHLSTQRGKPDHTRGFERVDMTYQADDAMVMLSVRYLPARVFEGPDGAAFAMLQELMRGLCTTAFAAEQFIVLRGLPFEISDVDGSRDARRINAFIGQQIDIEILTNADDPAVLSVLSQLDVVALNRMLANPLQTISSDPSTVLVAAR